MSAAVPLYRRVVATCGTCKAEHDEQAFKKLHRLRSAAHNGVASWWADCGCGSGVVALEVNGVWLTEPESASVLLPMIARGGK